MAPSKTSSASKTFKSSRPSPRSFSSKIPNKPEKIPNKSILSFFQKVDRPEESMFLDGDAVAPATTPPARRLYEDDDIYSADSTSVSNKRRKLSDPESDVAEPKSEDESKSKTTTTSTPAKPPQRPQRRIGPFLVDSDSEDEEDDAQEAQAPAVKEKEVWKTTSSSSLSSTKDPTRTNLTPAPEPAPEPFPLPTLKPEPTSNGDEEEELNDPDEDFDDDLLFDDAYQGQELREMFYLGGDESYDDGFVSLITEAGISECCPICNGSLEGVSPEYATVHVNSCLDGNPTPLSTTKKPAKPPPPAETPKSPPRENNNEELVSGPEVGKRFARAAVPRPGQANPISLGSNNSNGDSTASSAFAKLMSGHAEDAAWATAAAAENAARGKAAYQRTCPFYKIMPGFHICVDAFRYGAVEGCRAYFLSHFHSDHYIGLTANWTHGPIYCSKVTGSLVKSQLKTAEKFVVELEFEDKIPVPGTDGVFVTMIPANHCPGSSLFLFEKTVSKDKRVQRILHCGDFRACPAHLEHPQLKPETVDALGKIKQQKIDVCYLDTTYLNPRYSFPPQSDVIRACANLCRELDTTLRQQDESTWNSVLRRREGRGPGNNHTVNDFFAAADKPPGATDQPPTDSGKPESPPPNALSVLGQQARANRNRLLVVCGTYSIGKERICKAIAQALNTKIFASPSKLRICAQLGDPELTALLTSNPLEAQVHMQMLMELRAETLAAYLDAYRPHFGRIVGFRPSGWNYRPTLSGGGGGGTTTVTANMPPSTVATTAILHGPAWRTRFGGGERDLVPQQGSCAAAMCFGVPYSEHSSFRELMLFVMGLRIEKIVPTVNVGGEASRRRMKAWTDRWLAERRRGGIVKIVAEDKENKDGKKGDVKMWDGKDGRGGVVYW